MLDLLTIVMNPKSRHHLVKLVKPGLAKRTNRHLKCVVLRLQGHHIGRILNSRKTHIVLKSQEAMQQVVTIKLGSF